MLSSPTPRMTMLTISLMGMRLGSSTVVVLTAAADDDEDDDDVAGPTRVEPTMMREAAMATSVAIKVDIDTQRVMMVRALFC